MSQGGGGGYGGGGQFGRGQYGGMGGYGGGYQGGGGFQNRGPSPYGGQENQKYYAGQNPAGGSYGGRDALQGGAPPWGGLPPWMQNQGGMAKPAVNRNAAPGPADGDGLQRPGGDISSVGGWGPGGSGMNQDGQWGNGKGVPGGYQLPGESMSKPGMANPGEGTTLWSRQPMTEDFQGGGKGYNRGPGAAPGPADGDGLRGGFQAPSTNTTFNTIAAPNNNMGGGNPFGYGGNQTGGASPVPQITAPTFNPGVPSGGKRLDLPGQDPLNQQQNGGFIPGKGWRFGDPSAPAGQRGAGYGQDPFVPGMGQWGAYGGPGAGGFTGEYENGMNYVNNGNGQRTLFANEGLTQGGDNRGFTNFINYLNSYPRR